MASAGEQDLGLKEESPVSIESVAKDGRRTLKSVAKHSIIRPLFSELERLVDESQIKK